MKPPHPSTPYPANSREHSGTAMKTRSIKSLQIGMHWFPERAGGLDRMYYSLVGALPGACVAVRGVVAGSSKVAAGTWGAINRFLSAPPHPPLRLTPAPPPLPPPHHPS